MRSGRARVGGRTSDQGRETGGRETVGQTEGNAHIAKEPHGRAAKVKPVGRDDAKHAGPDPLGIVAPVHPVLLGLEREVLAWLGVGAGLGLGPGSGLGFG